MISGLAHSKIVEGRARKRIKCPVCQEDQNIDNCLEVEFWVFGNKIKKDLHVIDFLSYKHFYKLEFSKKMSSKDYKIFSKTREIFPHPPDYQSSRMICGHLNRQKMKPNPLIYLQCRNNKLSESKALAIANRCLCASTK